MNPQPRLARFGREPHPSRVVERRGLVGHQRGADDPAEVNAGRSTANTPKSISAGAMQAFGVDHFVAVLRRDVAQRDDPPAHAADRSGLGLAGRQNELAPGYRYRRGAHASTSTRARGA